MLYERAGSNPASVTEVIIMRQEDLCKGTTISLDEKPPEKKFKCPSCGRRLDVVSTRMDGYIKFFIPDHGPKGYKKQKKQKKR